MIMITVRRIMQGLHLCSPRLAAAQTGRTCGEIAASTNTRKQPIRTAAEPRSKRCISPETTTASTRIAGRMPWQASSMPRYPPDFNQVCPCWRRRDVQHPATSTVRPATTACRQMRPSAPPGFPGQGGGGRANLVLLALASAGCCFSTSCGNECRLIRNMATAMSSAVGRGLAVASLADRPLASRASPPGVYLLWSSACSCCTAGLTLILEANPEWRMMYWVNASKWWA